MPDIPIYGGTETIPEHVFLEDIRLYTNIPQADIEQWLDSHPEYQYNSDMTYVGFTTLLRKTREL